MALYRFGVLIMNKSLYRIIFNQARGQLMAVQETASGQGKGSGRGQNAAG